MATGYTIRAATIAIANDVELLFMGRPSRRTLVIAAAATAVVFVGVLESPFTANVFARVPAGNTLVMPFRDFGPLITGEIWVSCGSGGVVINGAEIYDIPTAR